jgi:8-hydroxy-5-deazaflavin:NADPH oxidoreductase
VNIAIIGTGNVGSALGGSLARAGHSVVFAGRDAAKTAAVAATAGGTAAPSPAVAAAGADVIVLAVPYGSAAGVAAEIAGAAAGKVVVDATNPLKADYSGLATGDGPSGAELLAAVLGGASLVKGFNTVFAGNQGNPAAQGTTLDALYATDDEAAATTFAALASSIGFRPVKVGALAAARELEALAWLNIRLQLVSSGSWQTAIVLVTPPESAIAA